MIITIKTTNTTPETDKKYLWKNFERDLTHFEQQNFFDNYNDIDVLDEKFRLSECFDLEDEITQQSEQLIDF